jgi:hypothetical protein
MDRRALVLAAAVFIGGAVGATAAGLPAGWKARGAMPLDYDMIRDVETSHAGAASASLRSMGMPRGFGTLLQAFQADEYRGRRVRMSATVRALEVLGWCGLWMRVDGAAEDNLAFDNMGTRKITGTRDWATYTIVLDVPRDAAEIYFGILLDGRGRVWADDFTFEVVGKDVKTTSMRTPRLPRRRPPAQDLLDHPVNLGFEEESSGP